MITDIRVLVAGCGSIGRRHITNLKSLGIRNYILCDTNTESLKKASEGLVEPVLATGFKEAMGHKPTAGVICTPSSLHLEMAKELASKGVHLLIEKPLSHTLEGVSELERLVEEKGIVAMMAMCYRFHPVFVHLRNLLASDAIGRVYHVNYYGGHYLPDWHPYADYRLEYASRKKLGGGVVLTSIHGLDTLRWLFGEAAEVHAFTDRVSSLETDVEDIAIGVLRMKSGVYVSWQTDFLQRANQHRMVVAAEKGTIRCDLLDGTVETYSAETGKWISERVTFQTNDMYVLEMKHFLDCIDKKAAPSVDIREGHRTLRLAVDVKASRDMISERERICRIA